VRSTSEKKSGELEQFTNKTSQPHSAHRRRCQNQCGRY